MLSAVMDPLAFEHHLTSPQGQGHMPTGAHTATVGGRDCCDQVTLSIAIRGDRVRDAGFVAGGCGAATAAASAAVTLVRGQAVLEAARLGPAEIARELGGLSPAKRHAAELASDALHRALGAAVMTEGTLTRSTSGRALVAMSGGVDSAVAALLCSQETGPQPIAVTLELWSDPENDAERSCCSASAVAHARGLAHRMGLSHFTVDLRDEFTAGVVSPFISGYAAGETPNPCIRCNGQVRIDAMLELADRLGCDLLATGHYARVADATDPRGPLLRVAADAAKDQSYMLAALSPSSLARLRFPLGELSKPEVRQIARIEELPVAEKPESQDLCFLAGTDRARFLARHGGVRQGPGDLVDRDGHVLGRHRGQHGFTVGQRRGIGLAGSEPLYVLAKDAAANRVIVGPRRELACAEVALRDARLHRPGGRVDRVKLRYRSPALRGRLAEAAPAGRHAALSIALGEQAEGVAPGQLACLMDGELVIGWGTIARSRAVNG
jgi:tRNA-uridine 2-sulfurtransferase